MCSSDLVSALSFTPPPDFLEQAPASNATAVRAKNVLRILNYFRFFEKIKISRLPSTAAAVEPIRIAILPRSIRSGSV